MHPTLEYEKPTPLQGKLRYVSHTNMKYLFRLFRNEYLFWMEKVSSDCKGFIYFDNFFNWDIYEILVQRLRKDENKYYEDMLEFGWKNLLLFPYHLSDVIIKTLNMTPFHYYINMLDSQMAQEKSYDSLPNFTAGKSHYK